MGTSFESDAAMEAQLYRYFLGFRPDLNLSRLLAAVGRQAGQRVRPQLLHLTLCVIAEARERDHFLLPRVRSALAGCSLSSFQIRLGRVHGGANGAMVNSLGRQEEIQNFYRALICLLAARGIAPLHRKSGLRPHVTLGHERCRFDPYKAAFEWFPTELLLIESEVGLSRHNVLGRWPLLPPSQGSLPFPPPISCRAAA
jgi:RNA 2',3'-cyclic 3'-phosphodiesterase